MSINNQLLDLSVIIPNTNSPQIGIIVERLLTQKLPPMSYEILVVGSDQPGFIPNAARVRFIEMRHPTHASDKRNHGMMAARGAILLFLDDDCIPAPDLLARHLARHAQGEQIVGGAITFTPDSYLQLADNLSAFHDLLPYTAPGPRPYLCTANLSMRREVVLHGGMLEPGRSRAEDLDWTTRLRGLGYRLYFEPTAIVWHNPLRHTPKALWRHWVDDAPHTLRVRVRHAALMATPALAHQRWPFLGLAPLIALWATVRTFSHPHTLRRYAHTVPVVYLTKLAWCWGAFKFHPCVTMGRENQVPSLSSPPPGGVPSLRHGS